jgi:hypothetical protein
MSVQTQPGARLKRRGDWEETKHMKHRRLMILFPATAALAAVPALAAGGLGVSLSPPLLVHAATAGNVGAFTVANTSGQAMKVTVSLHPWVQSSTGATSPNQRAGLSAVKLSTSSFTLADNGSQPVSLSLTRVPPSGSLYGNVDVIAAPVHPSTGSGHITFDYRLVGSIRLNPVRPRYGARVGRVLVSGTHSHGSVSLAVTNTGNSLSAPSGTLYVRGSGAANGALTAFVILPGSTVNVPVLPLHGQIPAGSYVLSGTIVEAGHKIANVRRAFTLR